MIPLVKNTITKNEVLKLADWLRTNPRLTRGELCDTFERKWSNWLGTSYSHFVNSGSSANLLIFEALKVANRLRTKNVIVPAVSWVTTVTPIIQTGLTPILCDIDNENLGLNIDHLNAILKSTDIGAVILVHVLGVPNKMDEILELRDKYKFVLIEDSCESVGSTFQNKKTGTFGDISSFSFYFGHHLSTIEGGMVCTNDEELYYLIKSIGSHGWARDLKKELRNSLEKEFNIAPFDSLYSFFYNGYNLRSTDLNAFIGLSQLEALDANIQQRFANYKLYQDQLGDLWSQRNKESIISNFAYGLIHKNRNKIVENLLSNHIECRPLICGSIGRQPFWIKQFGLKSLKNADNVHMNGFYIPNNPELTHEEISLICNCVLKYA